MKKTITAVIILLATTAAANDLNTVDFENINFPFPGRDKPNPELIPVREDPGPAAEKKSELIQQKVVSLQVTGYKETSLGYGSVTSKILIPDLASHTVFNHRNDGEDAPCLAGRSLLGSRAPRLPAMADVTVQIKNEYRINRDRKICKVDLVEFVTATIEGSTYTHTKKTDMGWRYIGDCPQ